MRVIGISLTLKGQELCEIEPALEQIAKKESGSILAQAFMPLDEILKKGWDPILRNTLDMLFPKQISFYENGPKRKDMADFLELTNATAYIIGNIAFGVKEECELYMEQGIRIQYIRLK